MIRCFLVLGVLVAGSAAVADVETKALLESADKVATKVAALRGLAIKRPIKRGVMDKAQLKARLLERVRQEYSPQELRNEELLLKRFGLLDKSASYMEIVVDLLTEQVAGFYDPWERQLYISQMPGFGGDALMAHEITHALQDQHFDLRKFMGKQRSNNDERVARQSLVEGDGMALMVEFLLSSLGQPAPWGNEAMVASMSSKMHAASMASSLDKAPLFLREGLIFPYLEGVRFVASIRKTSPWSAVDRAYQKPPLSSEHILHPDSYRRYERPDRIVARDVPAGTVERLRYNEVQGEHGLFVWLLDNGISRSRAELAARGWGGDRIAIYGALTETDSDRMIGAVSTTWDAEADAIEFVEAATDALAAMVGVEVPQEQADGTRVFRGKNAVAEMVRIDDRVVFVVAPDPEKAAFFRQHVSNRWIVTRR